MSLTRTEANNKIEAFDAFWDEFVEAVGDEQIGLDLWGAVVDLARVGASILPDENGEYDDNLKGALVYAAELLINGGATIQEATEAFVSTLGGSE